MPTLREGFIGHIKSIQDQLDGLAAETQAKRLALQAEIDDIKATRDQFPPAILDMDSRTFKAMTNAVFNRLKI